MPPTRGQERKYWDQKTTDLSRTNLETVQNSAQQWANLLPALLAGFGTVALAGGLSSVDDLPSRWSPVVKSLVIGAVVLASAATLLLQSASGNLFIVSLIGAGPAVTKQLFDNRARRSRRNLRIGRVCGLAAVAMVLTGAMITFVVGEESTSEAPQQVITIVNGAVYCGILESIEGGFEVGGTGLRSGVESVTPVEACP